MNTTCEGIQWSCVCRDAKILAEAGTDDLGGEVTTMAQGLLNKKDTPGWEFYNPRKSTLKSMKFHVYQKDGLTSKPIIWKFGAVYDPKTVEKDQVQSFLEKIVVITEMQRQEEFSWRYGDTLAAQDTFAPILLQRMQEVAYMGRMAMVNENIDSLKEVMASNIEMALDRGEKLEDMQERATHLEAMGHQFKKRARDVKRFQQWQNAKYGLAMGTLVTGVVAVVTVPPLVALL